jgi:hypothetical protein
MPDNVRPASYKIQFSKGKEIESYVYMYVLLEPLNQYVM